MLKTDSTIHDLKLLLGSRGLAFFRSQHTSEAFPVSRWPATSQHLTTNRVASRSSDASGTCAKYYEPAETYVTCFGGSVKNKHKFKRERIGSCPNGKAVLVGANDRDTDLIHASRLAANGGITTKPFITDNNARDISANSDDSVVY